MYRTQGLSVAYVNVGRTINPTDPDEYDIWAQIGYGREKLGNNFATRDGPYAETVYGPDTLRNRNFYWELYTPQGTWNYKLIAPSPLFGEWQYYWDNLPFHSYVPVSWLPESAVWVGLTGDHASWETELLMLEDRRVGNSVDKCLFSDLFVGFSWNPGNPAQIPNTSAAVYFDPPTPGPLEWGLQWLSATAFEVWDKFP